MRKMLGLIFPCGGGVGGLAVVTMRVARYRWTLSCTGGVAADIRRSIAHTLDSKYGCKRSHSTRSSGGRAGRLRPVFSLA